MMFEILVLCIVGAAAVPLRGQISPRAGEACGYESCKGAEEGMLNVHIVPHTHDDVGWLKTVDQYYYGSRNDIQKAGVQYILDSVIKELWEDKRRRFIYVETAFFWKWWVRQSDSVRHKVHVLVREGRLQFVGGAWSMNDEAASHYQSTVDQFTWGLSKLNQTFGPCGIPRVGWQIDPFGHAREFASLLAGMAYDGLFLGRIDYADKAARRRLKTMEMLWRGDDNLGKPSDIFTGVLHNTYSPPPGFCFDVLCNDEPIIDDPDSPMYNVDQRINKFLEYIKDQTKYYRTDNVIVTMGGDFTYQDATMWYKNLDKLIEYTNLKSAKEGLNIKLFYSTPDCYLKAVQDAKPTLPTKQDDFFPYASDPNAYWTGYFTSRPTTKFFERQGNNYLQMVKQLQVLAGLEDHNRYVLNELKSAMGVMQHHDAITGTEKQHVTHDYERLLDEAVEDALIIARQAFNKLMQGDALKPPILSYDRCRLNESSCHTSETSQQFVVTVYNHLAWHVNESIRIPVVEGNYAVYAPNGEQIVSQIVEIPSAVINIPTRQSTATHEIVFIAYLKPVSFKSYYIKKIDKIAKRNVNSVRSKDATYRRKNEFYANINDYWKSITETPVVDVEHLEVDKELGSQMNFENVPEFNSVKYKEVIRIPMQPFNVEILKDGSTKEQDIELIENTLKDAMKLEYSKYAEKALPSFSSEEMRMLSDDPYVVEKPGDSYVENEHFKLRIANNQITHIIYPDKTVKLDINFFYYPGCVGDNSAYKKRASGAYIFRPNSTTPFAVTSNYTQGPTGAVVKEIYGHMSDNVANTIRVYSGLNFVENDWVVGPIDIKDDVGKEFIVRYATDLVNNGEFYTDSNGRQMLKRKLDDRPTWNVTLDEPIAGNYYPVTNEINIKDGNRIFAVLPDRAEGGSSLEEGLIELMLHRRLLNDDAFGVGEALNEMANGQGLVVRGRHRIFFEDDSKEGRVNIKKQVLGFHLQPQVFVSDAKGLSFDEWMNLTKAHSWVNELPDGIHLLTLEPWSESKFLLRLENYFEKKDRADAVEVDLSDTFKTIEVRGFKETTLAANQWLSDKKVFTWNTENEFEQVNFDGGDKFQTADDNEGFKVKLKPKQIRTFVVDYKFKNV